MRSGTRPVIRWNHAERVWETSCRGYSVLSIPRLNKGTAFSPTDISAIKPWAKLMMITEAAVSLVIAGLVIARAINILA